MFHRILTVTLAALLAFESPVTAYAAQTDPDPVVGSAERTGSTAREFENNDEFSGGGIVGSTIEEETTGQPENPGQESENPDTEEENPEETDIPDIGEENPENPKNPDRGDGNPEEPEDSDKGEDPPEEPKNPGTEEEIPDGPVANLPEEDTPIVEEEESEQSEETENTVSGNSVSENTLFAASVAALEPEVNVTALSFDALSKDGVQITLPAKTGSTNTYVWYSFTAPEDGRYAFYTIEAYDASFYLCAEPDEGTKIRNGTPQIGTSLCTSTNYMRKGETLYIGAYTVGKDGDDVFTLRAAAQTPFTKNSDGTYTAALPEGDSITLRAKAGKSRMKFEVVKAAQRQYDWRPYYCPADHSEGDTHTGSDYTADTDSQGAQVCTNALLRGTYDTAFMVKRSTLTNKFVAFLSGMEPFAVEGADSQDAVYVHNAVCEENSITLELESLLRDSYALACRYQPADGSEEAREEALTSGWYAYVFDGLKAGTAYRFEIRDRGNDMLLKTMTYTTKASDHRIEIANANVSADFSKLTLKVKPVYSGTAESVDFSVSMKDSLQVEHSLKTTAALNGKDPQGYLTLTFDLADEGVFLKPGAVCPLQVSMLHAGGAAAAAPVTVKATVPKNAYVNAADVDFRIAQNIDEKRHADLTVTVKGTKQPEKVCVFYRPVEENRVFYEHEGFRLTDGKITDYVTMPEDSLGSVCEFTLSVGGVTITKELTIENDLGVHLERVNASTDQTGAFHFVRTYRIAGSGKEKLTGSCNLQLQVLQKYPNGKWIYGNEGKKVELNEANGYQATVSTTALGWTPEPDTDYRLRWVLSPPDDKQLNLLSVSYESVHTGKPHITIERAGGSHTSQRHTVTLGAEDAAALKESGTTVALCRYLREKGAQTYTKSSADYLLSAENNYSDTRSFDGLKADTEYEFSLRDRSGEKVYATDVFRTAKDGRALAVTKTVIHVNDVRVYYALTGFDKYSQDYVMCYYRRAGVSGAWEKSNAYQATEDGYFTMSGLKENTAYEYVIGIGKYNEEVTYLTHTVRDTVTTRIDTRRIEVSAKTRMTSARVTYQMFNMDVTGNNIVTFFWREKGQEQWKKEAEEQYFTNEERKTLSLSGLKENTVYEYRVGIAKTWSVPADDLIHIAEGEFQTAEDKRTVEIVSEPRAFSARVRYTLSGMENADDGYLLGYFKKASDADEAWKREYTAETGDEAAEGEFMLCELDEDTDYKLIMGLGVDENTTWDSLKHAETVTVKTTPDGRSLSEAEAEVDEANVTLRVKFSGNVERHASYLRFFYRVKGETAYKKVGRVVNVSGVEEENAAVTLSVLSLSLSKGTAYEFAAVLTNDGVCDKPEDVTRDAYKTFGSFTTAEAVKPASLGMSKEQLYLNANALYKGEKGFGYENLKVQWEPLTADAALVWESSDKAVATVTKDGKVSAVAAGKATIKATSVYAPEVSASCEVTVGDYQIGKKGVDGSVSLVDGAKLNAARGESCEGYVLCKAAGGNPVEVSSAEVYSCNESIAQWTDGVIATKRAGETRVVFTSGADQAQAFLTVSVQPTVGKGFAITGFMPNYAGNSYPALKEAGKDAEGREQYTMARSGNIKYNAIGEIMPSRPGFDSGDFNWSIDHPDVAKVDENGVVTPLKAGDAVLCVEPKNADDTALYKTQVCEVALHIRELPPQGKNSLFYALENTHKKLGDVKFPEDWAGWKWEAPNTPLVINGENRLTYSFPAVYTGEQYYPQERLVSVQIGRVTGITAYEKEDGNHNNVLEVGTVDDEGNPAEGADSLTLCVDSLFNGGINRGESLNYTWKVEVNQPTGLVVKEGEYKPAKDGRLQKTFTVTAVKKGNYTLTPVIKVTDPKTNREKTLAKTSFKIQAVAEKQAFITLAPEETAGVQVEAGGRITVDYSGDVKTFRMQAAFCDRNGEENAAFEKVKLAWSSSDKKVATVKASKDTHSAEIKIVGDGHTILTAKVKDKAGHTATAQIEIRNRAPRVNVSKVTVNPAYDFDSAEGKRLACESGGALEVVPAYGTEKFNTVRLWKSDKKTLETDLELLAYEKGGKYCYLICPTESVEEKTYDCYLGVESPGLLAEPFFHSLKVTVKTKQPQVTVKSVRSSNLFYRTDPASVDISAAPKGAVIESVTWMDSADGEENGFSSEPSAYRFDTTKKGKNVERLYFAQEDIRLTDKKKPAEPGTVSGKIKIRYAGYKDAVEKSVSLKWNYKKPAIAVKEKQATLIPSLEGHAKGDFELYNNTEKKKLLHKISGSTGSDDPRICYTGLTFHNADVKRGSKRDYTYVGGKTKGSEKLQMTIDSDYWRESLTAVHTIKLANPTPYLTKTKLVINTRYVSTAYTDIELKNAYTAALSCDDIVIEGKNAKSQALLDEDILEMEQASKGSNRIVVRTNRAQTMKKDFKNGTYDFKVTPCFCDASGNRIEGKTLTLKIQVTDKAVTAKVKLSGSLDLAKRPDKPEETDTIKNYVSIQTTFNNIGDDYEYTNFALIGEYSNYFSLFRSGKEYRIRIRKDKSDDKGKLKANQRYRLAIRYTLKLENGDIVSVQSPTFTVRPKQSVPKVIVHGNSQTLYAGNDALVRTCGFELPEGTGYRVKSISGGIDCNKDGKQDITLSWVKADSTDHYVSAELKLADRDGALTVSGMKGKTYTIPVVITLEGRDGLSKDVKTSIKVMVRR